uniref:HU family DNA-binding protein n=1 Tax=candidate division CPR3 bacterium TaxID=2268181 RepID=A0A7C4M0V4_UNCC3
MKKSDKEEFFDKLSIEWGKPMNKELAREVYFALISFIKKELPRKRILELPDFGVLKMRNCEDKIVKKFDTSTKTFKMVKQSPSIRFSADYKLKKICKFMLGEIWGN